MLSDAGAGDVEWRNVTTSQPRLDIQRCPIRQTTSSAWLPIVAAELRMVNNLTPMCYVTSTIEKYKNGLI